MAINLKIDDPKTLEKIERLRLWMHPAEFVGKCLEMGLRQAEADYLKYKQTSADQSNAAPKSPFKRTNPDFGKLEARDVQAALKKQGAGNPIFMEVQRLARDFTNLLENLRGKNHFQLKLPPLMPVEKIALDMAISALNKKPARKMTVH